MIKHDDFIFLHFPKTAGKSIHKYFDKHLKNDIKYRYTLLEHLGMWWLTEEERSRNMFGFVREPLSWYRSLYYFFRNKKFTTFTNGKDNLGNVLVEIFKGDIDFTDHFTLKKDFKRCMLELINTQQKIPLVINNKVERVITNFDYHSNLFLALFTIDLKVPSNLKIYQYEDLKNSIKVIQKS